jgi:hypothetical protein
LGRAVHAERSDGAEKTSFDPNDVNYQAYLKARSVLSANLIAEFDNDFIEYLCTHATATGTISSAMINAAITQRRATALRKAPTF